jgi:hypothetical protein
MKVKYKEDKNFREENGFGRCPDLTDGKVYEADEELVEINGETRCFVYDDSGDEDPTPYPVEIFDIEPEMATA